MLKKLVLVLILLVPIGAQAVTIRAEIKDGDIFWKDSQNRAGVLFPSWMVYGQVPASKKIRLGGHTSPAATRITLSNGAQSVDFGFEVQAIERQILNFSTDWTSSTISGHGCSEFNDDGAGNIIVGGVGCLATELNVTGSQAFTPFQFARPLIVSNEAQIIQAFKGKPGGVYTGSMSYSFFHDYEVPWSGAMSRHIQTDQVVVEIEYRPSFVTSVTVSGSSQEMPPMYNVNNETVSGQLIYQVDVNGWFKDGIKLSLLPGRTEYKMIGPSLKEIPYSIECIGCADMSLVSEGGVINLETTAPGTNVTDINLNFRLSYADVDMNTLENGLYTDSFILMVEPNF